jgi:hypothetical protein
MRRFETVLKLITFMFAITSFTLNLHLPFKFWVWQLITMIWVSICFVKARRIEELEIKKKYKK